MVSMKTEDHTGLYDHRQHPDSLPVRHQPPTLKNKEIAKSTKPSIPGAEECNEIQQPCGCGKRTQ